MPRFNTHVFAGLLTAILGAHLATAQTATVTKLTVQGGNGQVSCYCRYSSLQTFQPITVKATNASGAPVVGATVNWNVTSGEMIVGSATTVTDSNGLSTNTITGTSALVFTSAFVPYLVATVRAESNNQAVTFTETRALINTQDLPSITLPFGPTFGGQLLGSATLTANAGASLATPIQIIASGQLPVSNVSLRLFNNQASPTLSCVDAGGFADPGTVLTDAGGAANCYPLFKGSGTGTYYVLVGGIAGTGTDPTTAVGFAQYGPFSFTSNAGAPNRFNIISGNNQTGNVGVQLTPLVAQLVDANGNAVQGQDVKWSATPPGAVAINQPQLVTDSQGKVSTNLSLYGPAAAGAQITVALANNPAISTTFTASLPSTISLTKIAGGNESAQVNTNFATQVVVQVNNSAGAVNGQVVQFATTGPISLVEGNSITTGTNGRASVTVRAGATAGSGTVTASVGLATQTFNFTVTSIPTPTITGLSLVSGNGQSTVVNGSFQPLVVQVNGSAGPVANTQVGFAFNGPISISSAAVTTGSNGQAQITVQAGSTPGSASVTATAGGFSQVFNLTVQAAGPTITANSFLNAASRQVGSLSPCSLGILSAAGLTPNGTASYLWAPIFGRLPLSANGLSITFNGVAAPILNVAQGPTNPEVTFQVPCETAPGNVAVIVTVPGSTPLTVPVNVQTVSPGILEAVQTDGAKRAVAVRDDGSFADVGGLITNPVRRNERSRIYVTGLGVSIPQLLTNSIQNPNADLVGPAIAAGTVTVGISGVGGAQVVSVRQAPDLIGVYEVQFLVPGNAPTGNDVAISVGVVPAGSPSGTAAVNSTASKIAIQ